MFTSRCSKRSRPRLGVSGKWFGPVIHRPDAEDSFRQQRMLEGQFAFCLEASKFVPENCLDTFTVEQIKGTEQRVT